MRPSFPGLVRWHPYQTIGRFQAFWNLLPLVLLNMWLNILNGYQSYRGRFGAAPFWLNQSCDLNYFKPYEHVSKIAKVRRIPLQYRQFFFPIGTRALVRVLNCTVSIPLFTSKLCRLIVTVLNRIFAFLWLLCVTFSCSVHHPVGSSFRACEMHGRLFDAMSRFINVAILTRPSDYYSMYTWNGFSDRISVTPSAVMTHLHSMILQ